MASRILWKKKIILLAIITPLLLVLGLFVWRIEASRLNDSMPREVFKIQAQEKKDDLIVGVASTTTTPVLKMLFFGDIMLDRYVGDKIKKNGLDDIFAKLPGDFFTADVVSANLEGAVTNAGSHYDPLFSNDFAFAPQLVGGLKKYHFNFFNIANNHLTDQGTSGVVETRKNLQNLNIDYSGCIDAQVGTCTTKIIEVRGKKIGMVGLSTVYYKFDQAAAEKIVKDLKTKADLVIVNIHWGKEYIHEQNQIQEDVAHGLVEAGADAIIGHHPHVVEGIEIYQGKPIFYSLGNFIFDQYFSRDTQQELGVDLEISKENYRIKLYPIKSVQSRLELMGGQEREVFLKDLVSWSAGSDNFKKQIKAGEIKI